MKILALFLILFFAGSAVADQCQECELLAGLVKEYLATNATQTQIEAAALKICAVLPPSLSGTCQTLVKSYVPQLIQLLLQVDDPQAVCQQLGLCASKITLAKVQVGAFDRCSICEYLVGIAETWVEQNTTEEKLLHVFEDSCNILPGALKAVCTSVIEQYGPRIIQSLLNEENPDAVCHQIHLCQTKLVSKASPKKAQVKGGAECTVCELVISTVENLIKSNSSEAEIIKLAEKVCSVLPGTYSVLCKTFVDVYLPQVIDLVLQKADPQTVCTKLNLCTAKVAAQIKEDQADYCALCQFLVGSIENYITSNSTEEEVVALADKACSALPAEYSELCKQLAAQEIPLVFQDLKNKEPPQAVCTTLKLCTSKALKVNIVKA